MDALGRYYTQEKISNLLINKIDADYVENILELGIGDGSLTKAASKRWKIARFVAIDVDEMSVESIRKNMPFVNVVRVDSLENNFHVTLNISEASIDVAICNPPYLKHKATDKDNELFLNANLPSCVNSKFITTDIVFLAQNLYFLKPLSELAIILPDSIITNHYYKDLRRNLLENHQVKGIIQLPDNIFNKTEARTHILFLKKNCYTTDSVEISKADVNGDIVSSICIEKEKLIHRMDYEYNKWTLSDGEELVTSTTLDDLCECISRGNRTNQYFKKNVVPCFHTTSFKNYDEFIRSTININEIPFGLTIAEKGDILVARVGSRCIGKVALIESGIIPITDCIYRIKPKGNNSERIFRALKSESGQDWFRANSHGVCANVISKRDLVNFRVPFDLD